jgi:hypothetical protein
MSNTINITIYQPRNPVLITALDGHYAVCPQEVSSSFGSLVGEMRVHLPEALDGMNRSLGQMRQHGPRNLTYYSPRPRKKMMRELCHVVRRLGDYVYYPDVTADGMLDVFGHLLRDIGERDLLRLFEDGSAEGVLERIVDLFPQFSMMYVVGGYFRRIRAFMDSNYERSPVEMVL